MNKLFLKPKQRFEVNNNREYKVKTIKNSAIYTKKAKRHTLRLY